MARFIPPDAIVGRYRLADFLGAGGMGEVYRATHLTTGQVVAIKILTAAEIEARWLARVYHEARVQQGLNHPNIVKLLELIDLQGRPCLVMEYISGESLADRLERQRRIPAREALRLLQSIAWAVAYVHAQGIIHRDLKPANVRVTPDGQIKLLDFGISKSRHAEGLTQTGNVIGTPRYLSPEQILGDAVTPATDVWALGVLLHEMVTGQPPFTGGSEALMWARIDRVSYVAPSATLTPPPEDAALMRQIDRLVASCLTRDPARRPAADALAAAAADALTGAERISANARALAPAAPRPASPVQDFLERRWLLITAVSTAVSMVALATYLAFEMPPRLAGGGTSPAASGTASAGTGAAGSGAAGSGGAGGAGSGGLGSGGTSAAAGARPGADAGVHRIDVVSGRANVRVNGKVLGDTPVDYVGTVGETVSVELRQDGFEPVREDIQVTTTGTSTFNMRRAARDQP
ncbi:MAG: serine/threonine-protein kinase [Vicinamibacteraceae bacterium]